MLSGHWQMEIKVNLEKDSALIKGIYISGTERKYFILPENLTAEERKEYPLVIKDELTTKIFK